MLDGSSSCFRVIERNNTNTYINLSFFLILVADTLLLTIIPVVILICGATSVKTAVYIKSNRPSFSCLFINDLAFEWQQAAGDLVLINTSLFLLCKLSCSYAN